jgi:hypothetical protein
MMNELDELQKKLDNARATRIATDGNPEASQADRDYWRDESHLRWVALENAKQK